MKWTCRRIQEQSGALPGREPDRQEKTEIEAHARECPACREFLVLERELSRMAAAASPEPVPAALTDQVLVAWQREGRADRLARARRRHGTALWGLAFRALVDPLLWTDYQLQLAGAGLRFQLLAPLRAVRTRLRREFAEVCQTIGAPLAMAYQLSTRPLTGREPGIPDETSPSFC